MGLAPWPRVLQNYPIILIAIVYQYIEAIALFYDATVGNVTAVHALMLVFRPSLAVPFVIAITATMAWIGFYAYRKITTVLMLLPQQLLLYLGGGGVVEAIWHGHFVINLTETQAFLAVSQCLVILLAIFHTWAIPGARSKLIGGGVL